jgi:hypothetical protein
MRRMVSVATEYGTVVEEFDWDMVHHSLPGGADHQV